MVEIACGIKVNLPYGYEQYLEDGIRTLEMQQDHWREVFDVVKVTTKYNQTQIAEKLNVSPGRVTHYIYGLHTPRNKSGTLDKLKQMIKHTKQINKTAHGRIYE